jgi:exodeoxyribonuclease VII small subunit
VTAAQPGAAKPGQPQDIPYEQARDELAEVVRQLEAGGLTLEQSLELWERGERLAEICSQWLDGARARLAAAAPAQQGQSGRGGDSGHEAEAPF